MSDRIVIQKGGRIELSKMAPGLRKVRVELSWDPNGYDTGADWDLDVSVFGCAPNAEGRPKLVNEDYLLFYNSCMRTEDNKTIFEDLTQYKKRGRPATPCGGVVNLTGDNTSGKGDLDEKVLVDFDRLDSQVTELSIVVTIHEAEKRKQCFGEIQNSKVRLFNDETGDQLGEYILEDLSQETAVQFGSLFKRDGAWEFKAIGKGFKKGLGDFVAIYS
jgi:tellurium resistance protein TerD